ncbi:hypothetical protein [Ensifer sp.]|uniref:hypothetical protein n=1 Tax=Ensifer sp. TaxID=1872086 RepID=UPI00289BF888|nr:hypothetical protein [Ensifer sp.]
MGVAKYRLSAALPQPLQTELPTEAELAREFPLMSLVKLRIEIEREIRLLMANQTHSERPTALGATLVELQLLGLAIQSADQLQTPFTR